MGRGNDSGQDITGEAGHGAYFYEEEEATW